ncbi:MAG: zinc-binding dehydrogenase [Chloroflexi bacterium]|nr:zinc-binding dehydrogenase [Chloroflexota bacterium]
MRQMWISKAGAPGVLQSQVSPDPIPRSGEVRIRVEACGVTFADLMGRMGQDKDAPKIPFVPGYEVVGTVDLIAQGVAHVKEGDAVFALTQSGGYSDVVCVPYKQVFPRLDWMSVQDAAALPVDYLLAYLMLTVMGSLQVGNKVFLHGADGGIGLAALDICKILGAETLGTALPEKHDFLKVRGLTHPIDYQHFDYERVVMDLTGGKGVHLALDGWGGVHWPKTYRLLMPTGRLIHYGLQSLAPGKRRSFLSWWRGMMMLPFYTPLKLMHDNKGVMGVSLANLWGVAEWLRPWMQQIISWYDEAFFRPHIDETFPLADAALAHEYLHERQNTGKVLLIP